MTKEELEKEAVESAEKFFGKPTDLVDLDNLRIFKNGYLAGAEPREKQIAELEQKLEQTEKDLADYQFNYPTIKELQKENAELKGLVNQYKASKCGSISLVNRNMIMFDQLTKAKEIIKSFITLLTKSRTALDTKTCLTKAEQFLNSEVKK